MKLALLGGSFDPVHNGHLEIANKALETLDIDKLIVMPAYLNPFKRHSSASAQVRFDIVTAVFASETRVLVSDYEVRQNRSVPTIESVEYLQKHMHASGKIQLIVGADNVATLPMWKNFSEILSSCEIVVATRAGYDIEHGYNVLDVKYDISSTDIRSGSAFDHLPLAVADEIIKIYQRE